MPRTIIDLSHPLHSGMPVYPGDPAVVVSAVSSMDDGVSVCNLGQISLGLHAGTHMDAPYHFIHEGQTIDEIPLQRCIGEAVMIHRWDHGAGAAIQRDHLAPFESTIRSVDKVLLNTGWHHRYGEPDYFTAHPKLTGRAAQFLVDCGVGLVGVDFPAVDTEPFEAHTTLLGNGVLIVESLTNLDSVPIDRFLFVAFPLNIIGRDGSPVRAVALIDNPRGEF